MSRTVLILGATGNQGRAVLEASMAAGHTVHALVRRPGSPKAQALAARGVTLHAGDYDHPQSITAAARGMDAVFVNTSPFLPGVGLEGEVRHGAAILSALEEAGVGHVVYSSVSDADRQTGVPHFETKADAERRLAASSLSWTITAPVYFSDNLIIPWVLPQLRAGVLRHAMGGERPLHVVSLAEIGAFNAAVISRGTDLAGQRLNYASDVLTPIQMADTLSRAMGRPVRFERQPLEELRAMNEDMGAMYQWFEEVGYSPDPAALRAAFPEVPWRPFSEWAASLPWSTLLADGGA